MEHPDTLTVGLTFDDVILVPRESSVLPSGTDVRCRLTRAIELNIPLVSAAMDTVTEARMAIAMAQQGGIGIISDPITVEPDMPLRTALDVMHRHGISGLPVTRGERLVGIVTNRDVRFERDLGRKVSEVMTSENLVTARLGIALDEATEILHRHRIEKLLVVDAEGRLRGLITVKDIQKRLEYPQASKDERGRLLCGAAVGVGFDRRDRVSRLTEAGVDLVCVDTAHGHSKNVIDTVREIKVAYPSLQVVAGNVGTADGTRALIDAGVDAVKVGMGVGSICTTRIISGVGMPQLTAIHDACTVADKAGIPVIADGGIRFSGDITKAIAAGASTVMIGSLLAGTEESPGETVLYQGRTYKMYRGMGSLEAMRGGHSRDRYFQQDQEDMKLVPEGIEGRVPYKGDVASTIHQLVGGLRAGMGYVGAADLAELKSKSRFIRVSPAGLAEGHVHDVIMTKEPPNYRRD
jgi:IMP dehydrogenase